MTFSEEKLAKYKYFTSITAHMGQMPSKTKNSLFQNCFIRLTFKMCPLLRTECTALSFESLKKITTLQHMFGASTGTQIVKQQIRIPEQTFNTH